MSHFRLSFSNFALVVLLVFCFTKVQANAKIFNVKDYGGVEGGQADIHEALVKAWNDSCKYKGQALLEIPKGTYLVKPIVLVGHCNGQIFFVNKGTLKAPAGLQGLTAWFTFQYINRLTISGGGSFDGSGPPQHAAPNLPALLKFNFVARLTVNNVRLVNSMSTHLDLFACNNTKITQISISSPGDSPNTDGIKMGIVRGVTISDATIASGDDCVAILTGSKDVTVTGVRCGPGHGISIGSLGGSPNELVHNITVSNCNFTDTMNGVRIKTKATGNPGLVSKVQFQDLIMHGADNPILIDQNYCPSKTCSRGDSKVQIKNVKYSNIRGTSKVATAVRLECSASNHCKGIGLKDINLVMEGGRGATIATCSNVNGRALGTEIPKACI